MIVQSRFASRSRAIAWAPKQRLRGHLAPELPRSVLGDCGSVDRPDLGPTAPESKRSPHWDPTGKAQLPVGQRGGRSLRGRAARSGEESREVALTSGIVTKHRDAHSAAAGSQHAAVKRVEDDHLNRSEQAPRRSRERSDRVQRPAYRRTTCLRLRPRRGDQSSTQTTQKPSSAVITARAGDGGPGRRGPPGRTGHVCSAIRPGESSSPGGS